MITVSGNNITLYCGDTGSVVIKADSETTFSSTDRALLTIKSAAGTIMVQNSYQMEDNEFTLHFTNALTDTWAAGTYSYEVRYITNPVWDGDSIVDGDDVSTPLSGATITILSVLGAV